MNVFCIVGQLIVVDHSSNSKDIFSIVNPTTYGLRSQKWSIEGLSTLGITREITNFRKKEEEVVGN